MNLEQQLNETTQRMPTAAGQYLTFVLAGTEYGVDILRVQEIKVWDTATEIPNTPEYIRGIINLRGTIVPIVDLRKRFHMEAVAYTSTTVVVVLKVKGAGGERTMGFVVDAVSDVYNVTVEQIKVAPDFGTSVSTEFVKGLAAVGDKIVILLEIDQLVDTAVAMAEQAVTH
ncbi:MAG: purine-binding chemotaxis protein CheW [Gammaproteobacteria bacterium]|nr:purine-binding chemotaxis protein CheW [Gammaproteobacteria bacterium]